MTTWKRKNSETIRRAGVRERMLSAGFVWRSEFLRRYASARRRGFVGSRGDFAALLSDEHWNRYRKEHYSPEVLAMIDRLMKNAPTAAME